MDTLKLGSVGPGRECPGGTSIEVLRGVQAGCGGAVSGVGSFQREDGRGPDRVNHETLRQWIKAADEADSLTGSAGGLSSDERAELARLRKAEREWQQEREILRKAAQFFAKEMK